ncbi:tail assembly chaperone [Gordonia phage Lilbeanie]|uniref:Tail assembly chaperone n=1 Tax=Gordonia phage Lilbeanie TaxID=2794947 RepID=A0A7T1NWX1_9CAUD|nr:tail assembly chaperone [Gordonia phage Lilbeanie]QPO17105.1 tail assembly chaperone [Gordonia phage Lilbeanie]
MIIGPPWVEPARAWSIDGVVIEVIMPTTPEFVRALLVSEQSDASGLAVVAAFCGMDSWPALAEILLPTETGLTFGRLHRIADRLVETQLGLTRWRAQRLWEQAVGMWSELEGELLLSGLDLLALDPRQATNVVFAQLRKWISDADERKKWYRDLDKEPTREIRRLIEEEVPDEIPGQFDQMMAMNERRKRSGQPKPAEPNSSDTGSKIVMP